MEDVGWFSRSDVAAAISGDAGTAKRLRVPPAMAIAHVLMRAYVDGSPLCVFEEPTPAAATVAAL